MLLLLLMTFATGCSVALAQLARIGVRRRDVAYSRKGAVEGPQSNACDVVQASTTSPLPVQGLYSRSIRTRMTAKTSDTDDATYASTISLQITVVQRHEALLGKDPTNALVHKRARLRRTRQGRDHLCRGPRAADGRSMVAAWACVTVVSGIGMLISEKHYSAPVCLALSLNFWFATAWITFSTSLRIGSALLGLAVALRRSLWLFGKRGNCVLAPLPKARRWLPLSLLVCIARLFAMDLRKHADSHALLLHAPPPLHYAQRNARVHILPILVVNRHPKADARALHQRCVALGPSLKALVPL